MPKGSSTSKVVAIARREKRSRANFGGGGGGLQGGGAEFVAAAENLAGGGGDLTGVEEIAAVHDWIAVVAALRIARLNVNLQCCD